MRVRPSRVHGYANVRGIEPRMKTLVKHEMVVGKHKGIVRMSVGAWGGGSSDLTSHLSFKAKESFSRTEPYVVHEL